MNDFVNELKKHLINKYKCDSIIMYGSYARGDFTKESDVDILCLSKDEKVINDTSIFRGKQLDVWLKDLNSELIPQELIQIRDGIVIHDLTSNGTRLLEAVKECFEEGPPKKSLNEKRFLIDWMNKMYIRSIKNDIEGTYRYYWLVKDVLEIYFELKDRWYEGPKKSLKWLEKNDKEVFDLYKKVLNDSIASKNMKVLIDKLSNIGNS